MISSSHRRFFRNIQNTLILLAENNLTVIYNQPIIYERNEFTRISWPNHSPGKHNCAPEFGKINQYRTFIETGAYLCILFDGSLIRASYSFKSEFVVSYNLLWWPSPFKIDLKDLELGGVLDLLDLYADFKDWHRNIQMRTPVRFDLDIDNATISHR